MSFESLKDDLKNPEDSRRGLNSSYSGFYEFGDFRLDAAKRLLLREGVVVPLTPKALDVLLLLVSRHGHVVVKDELLRHVWPDTIVEENNLNVNVSMLRKVLGEKPNDHRFIVTVPGRGYQFVSEVRFIGGEEVKSPKGSNSAVSTREFFADGTEPHGVKAVVSETLRFDGQTESDVLVSILEDEPPSLDHDRAGQSHGPETFVRKAQVVEPIIKKRSFGVSGRSWLAIAMIAVTVGVAWYYYGRFVTPPRLPPMKIVPLTTLPGFESSPSFSPDGNFVAFCWSGEKDDNIDVYIQQIGSSGPPLRLTTDPAADYFPVWSPDGKQIAFSRFKSETDKALFIINAPLGGPERKIRSAEVKSIWGGQKQLDWSPDGKFIAAPDKLAEDGPYQILLISLDTLKAQQLTFAPDKSFGDLIPQFSPDGRSVAFIRSSGGGLGTQDIYIVPVVGGEPRRLTFDNQHIDGIAWTADGREIVFSSGRFGLAKLWRVNASGGTPERLAISDFGASFPTIARKGDRLAFVKKITDTNMYRLNLDRSARSGGATPKFAPSTQLDWNPDISPDSKRVAFESERSGEHEIWLCNHDGSEAIQLTTLLSWSGSPSWSPDGQQIAFDSREKGSATADIYLINAQGGAPRRLTTVDDYDDVAPSWSKDGQWIYFSSKRSGDWQLWKVPVIGGDPVQVTKQGGQIGFEASDGKFVYYAKGPNTPGIWRVPIEGGDEVPVMDSVAGFWGNWAVTSEGIYYINPGAKSGALIEFFSFASRRISEVASLGRVKVSWVGLAVSPDGKWALYTLVDHEDTDIMLAENFR